MVYGSGLENQRVFTGTVGSNPTLSAFKYKATSESWRAFGGHPQRLLDRQNERPLLSIHAHRDDFTDLRNLDT